MQHLRGPRWSIQERFWRHVAIIPEHPCWEWVGATTTAQGYGRLSQYGNRTMAHAHRVSWEIHRGPIPEGMEIDHLCRNPHCVNPDHLEPVTHAQNMGRGKAARKMACKYGHDWRNPKNVYIRKNGTRICAECARTRWPKKR